MNPSTTPVLLVVAGNKIPDLHVVIDSLKRLGGFQTFYIVCPPSAMSLAEQTLTGSVPGVHVVDEEAVISGLNVATLLQHLPPRVPGWPSRGLGCWYYQQFLKMGFAQFATEFEYYLIWDADTVLTRPVSFYRQGRVLLTASHENHKDYFRTIARLLPGTRRPGCSHISQHALVRTADMRSLLGELGAHGVPWWQYILSTMTGKTPQQFSEYETYAAYCLSRWPQHYQSIWRRWLRSGSSYFRTGLTSADVSALSDLYDFVAFEEWDRGPRRRRRCRMRVRKDRVADWCDRSFGWTWYPK